MTEEYDDLEWEINDFPIGSSTPDEFFENSYRATAICQGCGNKIDGTANYWSRDESMAAAWLESVDYKPCEYCESADVEEDPEDDEF